MPYFVAVRLGATPGCLGPFAVVALYTHGMLPFGALVGCMIATSGDEAFVMLALFPAKAFVLMLGLALLGLLAGIVVDRLARRRWLAAVGHEYPLHALNDCRCFPGGRITHSRLDFLKVKAINLDVGLLIGSLMILATNRHLPRGGFEGK